MVTLHSGHAPGPYSLPPSPDLFFLSFAGASPATRHQVKILTIRAETGKPFKGSYVARVLLRMPALVTLHLLATPPPDNRPFKRQISAALESLPRLTRLTLNHSDWLSVLSPNLAAQLTSLTVRPPNTTAQLSAPLSAMTALRELTLACEDALVLHSAEELRQVLDFLPASTQRLQLHTHLPESHGKGEGPAWDQGLVSCTLSDGRLQSFKMEAPKSGAPAAPSTAILSFLAKALLPSKKLGPRLGRLELRLTALVQPLPDPNPAAELLARSTAVLLSGMRSSDASTESVLRLTRLLGAPEVFELRAQGPMPLELRLQLPRPLPSAPPSSPGPNGGVRNALSSSRAALSPDARAGVDANSGVQNVEPLAPAAVLERVVRRMVDGGGAAAGEPSGRPDTGWTAEVLLRGPAVQALLEDAPALRMKAKRISRQVAEADPAAVAGLEPHLFSVHRYQSLPAVQAVLLLCDGEAAALAAVEAARSLAQSAGLAGEAQGSGQALPPAPLQAGLAAVSLSAAGRQVLEAIWEGKEDGAPHNLAVLDRLRWILQLAEGVRGLVPESVQVWG
ncbi:hypothetical protein HYH03_016825 [Edaphochlamys debaryana]|uniref:Uncharacterized protein n=1 Tax=Edaphochlamys debaryana TaxID=47281 RepID=A0A835XIG5_9CHLO|nr:hypothetical protein HYH03_016825 [Edaphochlamys debaryana]|eukprot:KAG2484411.1 hypothetical protein HYH03_016825 [Edaphochlamys debaryana]